MSSLKLTNTGQLITYDSEVNEMLTHENVEVAIEKDQIVDIGKDLGDADQIVNCDRKLVTPGFVDPHTHPVFLGGDKNEILDNF